MTHDAAVQLEELIYDSVVDETRWSAVVSQMAGLVDASSVLLFDTTRAPDDGGLWVGKDVASEATQRYVDHFGTVDVWIAAALANGLPRLGNLWLGEQVLDQRALRGSEFFNDFLKNYDIGRLCTAVLSVEAATGAPAVWGSFYRPPHAEPFAADRIDALRRVVPHLSRAVRLREKLGSAAQTEHALRTEAMLDQLSFGVVCLRGDGRVASLNDAARRIVSAADGLAIRNGKLACAHRGSDQKLCAITAGIVTGGRGGGDLAVLRPSGRRPYLVTAVPLSALMADHVLTAPVRAVVYLFEPDGESLSDAGERLGAFFGLTTAERRVAELILQDASPSEIAERHGVSVETVRSQLKSLFAKTGTSRQSQLVRRLREASMMPGQRRPQ